MPDTPSQETLVQSTTTPAPTIKKFNSDAEHIPFLGHIIKDAATNWVTQIAADAKFTLQKAMKEPADSKLETEKQKKVETTFFPVL